MGGPITALVFIRRHVRRQVPREKTGRMWARAWAWFMSVILSGFGGVCLQETCGRDGYLCVFFADVVLTGGQPPVVSNLSMAAR